MNGVSVDVAANGDFSATNPKINGMGSPAFQLPATFQHRQTVQFFGKCLRWQYFVTSIEPGGAHDVGPY